MRVLKILHYAVGLVFLVLFLLTGQYMDLEHDHLSGMADGPRMIYRSGHIYLLFTSIANLLLGVYLRRLSGFRRHIQILVCIVLLIIPWILLYGFFAEPHLESLARPYSRIALYGTFGVGLMLALLGPGSKEST